MHKLIEHLYRYICNVQGQRERVLEFNCLRHILFKYHIEYVSTTIASS